MASVTSRRRLRAWIRSVRALPWRDRWLLAQALVCQPVFAVLLRVVAFRTIHRVCTRLAGDVRPTARPGDDLARVREIGRVVAIASRHAAIPGTCLHRSLTLWWLLLRRGFASDLRLGARKVDGTLTAHAWVEHDGVVINDDAATTRGYSSLHWVAANPRS